MLGMVFSDVLTLRWQAKINARKKPHAPHLRLRLDTLTVHDSGVPWPHQQQQHICLGQFMAFPLLLPPPHLIMLLTSQSHIHTNTNTATNSISHEPCLCCLSLHQPPCCRRRKHHRPSASFLLLHLLHPLPSYLLLTHCGAASLQGTWVHMHLALGYLQRTDKMTEEEEAFGK